MATFCSVRSPAELVTGMLLNPADEIHHKHQDIFQCLKGDENFAPNIFTFCSSEDFFKKLDQTQSY